jgi:hypothetical protein
MMQKVSMVGSVRSGFPIAPLKRMLWPTSRPCQLPSEGPSWQPEQASIRAIPMQKQYSGFLSYLIFDQYMKPFKTRDLRICGFSGLQVPVSIVPRGDLVCAS